MTRVVCSSSPDGAPTTSARGTSVGPVRTFGLMQVGNARVALPISAIREVVQGQPRYDVLPIKAEGLLGAIDIRGTIVPVLDLRVTLGLPADQNDSHVVVILCCDSYLIGLRVEAVFGIMQVKPADLCDLTASGLPSEMLASQAFESNDGIVTILDPTRIANRPGLPKVAEKIEQRAVLAVATASVLLFTHGRSHLGIDADCIDAAIPDVAIDRDAMATGFCLGTIEHRGYIVPVVDTTAAIGLGLGPRPAKSAVVVIRFGEKSMLGLAVDAVRDIVSAYPDDILTMPALKDEGTSYFRGMLLGKSEPHHLLLDLDNLRLHLDLIDLARLCRPKPRLVHNDRTIVSQNSAYKRGEPYIRYLIGGEFATRLEQIAEVLPYPDHVASFVGAARGVLGLFKYRRRLVPLICLGRVVTDRYREIDIATARVLFVEEGDHSVGFVVDTLVSIDDASLESGSAKETARQTALMGSPFVVLGDARRMVSHIDLVVLIKQIYAVGPACGIIDHVDLREAIQASA